MRRTIVLLMLNVLSPGIQYQSSVISNGTELMTGERLKTTAHDSELQE